MKQEQGSARGTAIIGSLILAALAAILYGLTLSRHYTADSLISAWIIERADLQTLIDPTHILLYPMGLAWFRAWQALGWAGRSLYPLQILNGMAGAICVGLMWALVEKIGRSKLAATFVAAGIALSGGLWLLSVEAEFVTIPLALQLLTLWLVLATPTDRAGRASYAVLIGIIVAIGMMSYLTSAFLVIVTLVGFITADLTPEIKWRQIAIFIATVFLLIIPILFFALTLWSGGDVTQMQGLGGQGVYGQFRWFNLSHGFYAFLRTLGLFPGLAMNDSTRALLADAGKEKRSIFFAYYSLIALLAFLPVLCLLRRGRILWAQAKRSLLVLLAWTVPFAAFAFFWVPGDVTFWLPILVAWWILVAICWSNRNDRRIWRGGILVVLILGIINATQVILPRMDLSSNKSYQSAILVAKETRVEDAILIEANDIALFTVTYFAKRRVLPLYTTISSISDIPTWMADSVKEIKRQGGRFYGLDSEGRLRELE